MCYFTKISMNKLVPLHLARCVDGAIHTVVSVLAHDQQDGSTMRHGNCHGIDELKSVEFVVVNGPVSAPSSTAV